MKNNGKKRKKIGLLVSGIMDEFSQSVCRGVCMEAQKQNADVVVFPGKYLDRDLSASPELMYEYQYSTAFSCAQAETIDAVVAIAGSIGCYTTEERIRKMLDQYHKVPVVQVASRMQGYSSVMYDNYTGIREGLIWLIEHGCRKFAMVGANNANDDVKERKQTFCSTLEEYGIPFEPHMFVEGDISRRNQEACARLLDQNPGVEAIFCVNDEVALGLYAELAKRGMYPGRDVSVLGYDDSLTAARANPSLSSVWADGAMLGEKAVGIALRMIAGGGMEQMTLPTRLVKRNSFCGRKHAPDSSKNNGKDHKERSEREWYEQIFYRHNYGNGYKVMEPIRESFHELYAKLEEIRNLHGEKKHEEAEVFWKLADSFFDKEAVNYADIDALMEFFQTMLLYQEKSAADEHEILAVSRQFSKLYQSIVSELASQYGSRVEKEKKHTHAIKLYVQGMMEFEHGNDASYRTVIQNLGWIGIRNASLFLLEQPKIHLQGETFELPEYLYLKAALKDGKSQNISVEKQKITPDRMFAYHTKEQTNKVLFPIFSNEFIYGFLLLDLTEEIFQNGEFYVNQFQSAIKMISLLNQNEQMQQRLEVSLQMLKENNIALDTLSKSDGLTEILNRRGFYDMAEELQSEGRTKGQNVIVMYVDMNNLKIINDRYGHEEGDFSLKLIGQTLKEFVDGNGIAGRIGGDEFACLVYETDPQLSERMPAELAERFDAFNKRCEKTYQVTVSAGCYVIGTDETITIEQALIRADEKMYEMKQLRKKNVENTNMIQQGE
ncbi:MAG: GGDEF domain-containing protein [Lachnospiraceae bacterium]|nr:GGDEF domain-containing protein [Lachnospiraceae bacterium]